MENLKNYRISLKFSEKDSEQAEVAKLLKQLGRKKSAFITKAIKYYLANNPSPEIPGNNNVITNMLTENLVKATILKMIENGELTYSGPIESKKSEQEIPVDIETKKSKPQKVTKVSSVQKQEKVEPEKDENNVNQEDVDNLLKMLDGF